MPKIAKPASISRRYALSVVSGAMGLALTAPALAGVARSFPLVPDVEEPFDFEWLIGRMAAKAQSSYAEERSSPPGYVASLDYDQARKIVFREDRAQWQGTDYRIAPYHLSALHPQAVSLFEVDDGIARPLTFGPGDFNIWDPALRELSAQDPVADVAGFRVNSPINYPGGFDELVSFLGASYFRAVGRDNVYGVSARGISINSATGTHEEFPRFTEFYLERCEPGQPLVICAALEGESLTGAYRFEVHPANGVQETSMLVSMHLNFRKDVGQLGIAPLTSMFLYAENNRSQFDDYRRQVHDSEALMLLRSTGERLYRPLNNPPVIANSFIFDSDPAAFGLVQRDRAFESYMDPEAKYERRPSLMVEPIGNWGQGNVRLIELPTRFETVDNIVAFWVPQSVPKAGDKMQFTYRLKWGDISPDSKDELAYVASTMTGPGGIAGAPPSPMVRKFVVDFAGGTLAGLPDKTQLDVVCRVTGGELLNVTLQKIEANETWRMVVEVDTTGAEVVEMRAYIAGLARILSETWLYQWRLSNEA